MLYPGELPYMFLVSGTQILDSIRWGGFSISRAEFWIPKLSIPDSARKTVLDSGFCEQKFPVIQIQITLHGASPSLNIERRYI